MMKRFLGVVLALALAGPVAAQDMTLRDIRDDLAILTQQIEALRLELGATGNSGLAAREAAGAQVQIDELSADLRAALGRIESLEIKVQQIIEDGTRRIGDMEFRLSELEGGDTTLAINPAPLGGTETETEVLSAERKAFNDANDALADGDGVTAASLFSTFLGTFPDGPLTTEVRYLQGESHALSGDYQNAARAYLSGFSGAPDSPFAPLSLYGLSISLFQLGQGDQACLTLAEIQIRYVDIDDGLARSIIEQRETMACP